LARVDVSVSAKLSSLTTVPPVVCRQSAADFGGRCTSVRSGAFC